MPSGPSSRPMPDFLKPPKGPLKSRIVDELIATDAGADLGGHLGAVLDVGGPDRAAEAVVGVVGDGDGLLLAVVGDDRQDRAEDLLLGDLHVVVDVGEDGRLDVPALGEVRRTAATGDDAGTGGLAGLEVALDAGPLALGHERADLGGGVERVADDELADRGAELRRRSRRSGLRGTRMRVWAPHTWPLFIMPDMTSSPRRASSSTTSSSTMAADLPPSSSVPRLSCSPQISPIFLPAAVEPVKLTLSMPGWRTRCSPFSRPAGTMLRTPGGDAGLDDGLGQQEAVERGLGRGLEHDGAAGDHRRAELERGDEQRDVPRGDGGDDADRRLAARAWCHPSSTCGCRPTGRSRRSRRSCRAPSSTTSTWPMIDHDIGEPFCDEMSSANSCILAWMLAEKRPSTAARSTGFRCGHGPWSNAWRAAATALSMSSGVPSGTWPMTSSVAGEMTSMTPLPVGGHPLAADVELLVGVHGNRSPG